MFFLRLGRGAFVQAKSSTDIDITSGQTTTELSTTDNQTTDQNIIVSTRLRQTDKRLRKIHSFNNINKSKENSENLN